MCSTLQFAMTDGSRPRESALVRHDVKMAAGEN